MQAFGQKKPNMEAKEPLALPKHDVSVVLEILH